MAEGDRRIRIGVDGYNMASPRGTGVATYGRTLAAAIHELDYGLDLLCGVNIPRRAAPELRESLFYGRLSDNAPLRKNWRRALRNAATLPFSASMAEIPISGRVIDRDFSERLPRFDRLFNRGGLFEQCARHFRRYRRFMTLRIPNPPDIMHWTYPLPLTLAGARNIYTFHDLVPLRLPHTSLEDKRYYDALVRACLKNGDHIVTVSESSKRDIVALLDADPNKITNTYQSAELPAARSSEDLRARLASLFDLRKGDYFLFFGAVEPKKNLGRLIEAYLESGVQTPLVLVGGDGWHADRELRLLGDAHGRRLPGTERIRRIEYLPRTMLFDVVRGARAVLFPSLYEGFGLPALEAIGCGIPVLASTAGSLPEIVGDAALTVDPYDVRAMAAALRQLDSDPELRARLAMQGPQRFAAFDLSTYCQSINSVYRALLER
jgi:glycosyltransferase involved in cell wall biosynthesis